MPLLKHFKTYPLQGAVPMNFSSEGTLRLLKSSCVLRKHEKDGNKSILHRFVCFERDAKCFLLYANTGQIIKQQRLGQHSIIASALFVVSPYKCCIRKKVMYVN